MLLNGAIVYHSHVRNRYRGPLLGVTTTLYDIVRSCTTSFDIVRHCSTSKIVDVTFHYITNMGHSATMTVKKFFYCFFLPILTISGPKIPFWPKNSQILDFFKFQTSEKEILFVFLRTSTMPILKKIEENGKKLLKFTVF